MKILGIDIGGTGIKAAVVDTKTGELLSERHRIDTPKPATPEAVAKVVKEMITHFKWTYYCNYHRNWDWFRIIL